MDKRLFELGIVSRINCDDERGAGQVAESAQPTQPTTSTSAAQGSGEGSSVGTAGRVAESAQPAQPTTSGGSGEGSSVGTAGRVAASAQPARPTTSAKPKGRRGRGSQVQESAKPKYDFTLVDLETSLLGLAGADQQCEALCYFMTYDSGMEGKYFVR